ncbi:MAG TPA: metal-binding protein [Chthonomonadaceae bacterium]|nr:metal-binding protein [Chthonomonadaceae bacterium]
MPGAHTHDMITLVTAGAAGGAYLTVAPHPNPSVVVLFTASYLFAGYACAGDLDTNSKEYRRWGALRFLWWPYRKMVPHRSWVSHGMILGGLIRVAYLATVCTLLLWGVLTLLVRLGVHLNPDAVTGAEWQSLCDFARLHPQWTLALLAGFILAGTTHTMADLFFSGLKRRF